MIDPEATTKDYTTIIYNKTEIDAQMSAESSRIGLELDNKSSKNDEGSPSGIATLDSDGKLSEVERPIATVDESQDVDENTKTMTPRRVHALLQSYDDIDTSESKYGDLKSDGSIQMSASYNPQDSKDVATVEYVQTLTTGASSTFVVDTLAEMIALTSIDIGDTCFVTNDVATPDNNGEYIANVDNPSSVSDWTKREAKAAWGGIIGDLSDQTDLRVELDSITDTTDKITVTQNVNLDTMKSDIDLNTAKVSYTDSSVVAQNTLNISSNATDIEGIENGTTTLGKTLYLDKSGNEPTYVEGQVFYADGGLKVHGEYSDTVLNVGQEQYIKVYNGTGSAIPNGSVVTCNGLNNGIPAIKLAIADSFDNARILGVATMAIPTGESGLVTTFGSVSSMNTNSFTAGTKVYLSSTVPGGLTSSAPSIVSLVGTVLSSDLAAGKMFVRPRSTVSTPMILGNINGGSGPVTIDSSYTDITNYSSNHMIGMTIDMVNGTVTIPEDGLYEIAINFTITCTDTGGSRTFNLKVVGSSFGDYTIPVGLGRNDGVASTFPSITVEANAGDVLKLQVGGDSTVNDVAYTLASMKVKSERIVSTNGSV